MGSHDRSRAGSSKLEFERLHGVVLIGNPGTAGEPVRVDPHGCGSIRPSLRGVLPAPRGRPGLDISPRSPDHASGGFTRLSGAGDQHRWRIRSPRARSLAIAWTRTTMPDASSS